MNANDDTAVDERWGGSFVITRRPTPNKGVPRRAVRPRPGRRALPRGIGRARTLAASCSIVSPASPKAGGPIAVAAIPSVSAWRARTLVAHGTDAQ